jgi:hypothetical protein
MLVTILCISSCHSLGEVEKTAQTNPSTSSLTGIIEKEYQNEGTLSEYSYFIISTDRGTKTIIFNENGHSSGFSEWEGRKVVLSGKQIIGTVGFKRDKVNGFLVTSIRNSIQ